MASFLARQLGLPASGINFYTDDGGSVHEGDINAITAAGIALPCGPGHYCPNSPLKRDVMATMLARALGLVPIAPPPPPGTGRPDPAPDITRIKDVSNSPGYVVIIGEPSRFTDPDKDEFDLSDGTGTIEIDLKADFGPISLNTCYIVGGPGGGSEIEIRTDEDPPGFVAKIGGGCPNGIDDF